ncbi:MAG: AraC/XylS family transcriptional regulatory protein [Bradyrhizobium sp.]|nr:AraC/XylS family transcriptional regulatory protein [Bradyrhizobium sp.]
MTPIPLAIGSFWTLWHLLINVRFNNALRWAFLTSIGKPQFALLIDLELHSVSPMTVRANLLSSYPGFATRDLEQARDHMSKLFGATRFEAARSGVERLGVSANVLRLRETCLIWAQYAGQLSLGFAEGSFVRQYFTISGKGRFSAGALSGEISVRGPSPVIPAFTPIELEFEQYNQLVLRIEHKALKRYLGVLLGEDLSSKELVFHHNASNPVLHSLRRSVFLFVSDYNARGKNLSDLVTAETERMLTMKFLMSNWHNYTLSLLRQPPRSSPSAVKKVEDYVEANWDKPIDIEAMAQIANVSARSLFREFKKERGCSPAVFAKQIRLNRAKEMLEQADGPSIIQVAYKCGFQNPSHFAKDFKLAFGELPSETLKRLAGRRS